MTRTGDTRARIKYGGERDATSESGWLHGCSRITARDLGLLGWTLGDTEPNTFHKNRVCKTICKTL